MTITTTSFHRFILCFTTITAAWLLLSCADEKKDSNAEKMRVILRDNNLRLSTDPSRAFSYDPPGSLNTSDKPVMFQSRGSVGFSGTSGNPYSTSGVYFSNAFAGARLNSIAAENDSTFVATIMPENAPVNFSPWYSFCVWSRTPRAITVRLTYRESNVREGGHRYAPKVSANPRLHSSWRPLDSTAYTAHLDTAGRRATSATLRLFVSPDTLWVSAQERFTSLDFEAWATMLATSAATRSFVRKSVLGRSVMGKLIIRLDVNALTAISSGSAGNAPGSAAGAPCVIIVSRQHPPEHTGTLALMPFVETIVGDTPLAKEFRSKFRVVIMPCLNPDGVDEGHWRHNAHGVDLNRDWNNFNQPETRLVRDALLAMRDSLKTTFPFAIDFHSTQHDVFYTLSNPAALEAADSAKPELMQLFTPEAARRSTLMQTWLGRVQMQFPTYQVIIDDSPRTPTGATSARWFDRVLLAPAVTYEVGDETDRTLIRQIGVGSAQAMMELLLGR
jgi:cytosolic carboxypeptidase protein 6